MTEAETKSIDLPNGSRVYFSKGRFDDWCVFLQRAGERPFAPRDEWYFSELVRIASPDRHLEMYGLFVRIYEATSKKVRPDVVERITSECSKFGNVAQSLFEALTVIYFAMIAEENRANTRLGRRVKRLGVHQILLESVEPSMAANFSKGMRWPEISALCESRGF